MLGKILFYAREIVTLGVELARLFNVEIRPRNNKQNEMVNGITIDTRGDGRTLLASDFGAGKITAFRPSDLGAGWRNVSAMAAYRLNQFKLSLPYPSQITSAWRSPEHNKSVGGSKSSRHLKGLAFDIQIADPKFFESRRMSLYVDLARRTGFKGVGLYEGEKIIHVDVRPKLGAWGKLTRHGKKVFVSLADFMGNYDFAPPAAMGAMLATILILLYFGRRGG